MAPDTLTDLTVADLVNISHSIRIHIINFIWLKSVRASTASIIEQLFVILYVAIWCKDNKLIIYLSIIEQYVVSTSCYDNPCPIHCNFSWFITLFWGRQSLGKELSSSTGGSFIMIDKLMDET